MAREFEHIRRILIDTVTILCKNSIHFDRKLNVQGLIGITLDEGDVLLVHINEEYKCSSKPASASVDDLSTDSEAERSSVRFNPVEKLAITTFETNLPRRRKRRKPGKTNVSVAKCSDSAAENNSDTEITYNNEQISDLKDQIAASAKPHDVSSPVQILNTKIKSERINDDVEENNTSQTVEEFFTPVISARNYVPTDPDTVDSTNCTSQVSFKFGDDGEKADSARDLSVNARNSHETFSTPPDSVRRPVPALKHRPAPYELNYGDAFNPSPFDMLYGSIRERRSAAASAEKTFRCNYDSCSKAYYDKKNLLRHQTRHHGRVPAFQRNMRYNTEYVSFNDDYMTID